MANIWCRCLATKTKWRARKTQRAKAAVGPFGHAGWVRLRYNYRLDPAPSHRIAFGKAFGCARVVFNDALRTRQQAQEAGLPYVTDAEVSARLTTAKRAAGRA